MANNIVTVSVTQTIAPLPSTLQQTGAFISQGGTNTASGTLTFLTQLSDLTAILATPLALTSLAWSSGTVTATTTAPHGFATSSTFEVTIAGTTPTGYSGTFLATATGTSTFTYPLASSPGTTPAGTPGTYTPASTTELVQMATTFFAQGSSVGIYVLELGSGAVNAGVTALTAFITANPATIYAYLVPRAWDANASFLSLLATFESTTAKTYFYVTTTNANFSNYTVQMKCVLALVEAPTIFATEFTQAAVIWQTLHYAPSSSNKVTPLAFSFLFGVTPYPLKGNGSTLAAWKAAGVNYVGTGSEGGITTACLFWGTTMDVRPFNYWYSVDWTQINVDLFIANAVINGSNNPINPLYDNQDGINRLQAVGAGVLSSGVTFGMILGTVIQTELDGPTFGFQLENGAFAGNCVINAIPFVAYYTASPSDYRLGVYNGFSVTMTPLRGFESITFFINVTDFVAGNA